MCTDPDKQIEMERDEGALRDEWRDREREGC